MPRTPERLSGQVRNARQSDGNPTTRVPASESRPVEERRVVALLGCKQAATRGSALRHRVDLPAAQSPPELILRSAAARNQGAPFAGPGRS
jgi:hypothetical protein